MGRPLPGGRLVPAGPQASLLCRPGHSHLKESSVHEWWGCVLAETCNAMSCLVQSCSGFLF